MLSDLVIWFVSAIVIKTRTEKEGGVRTYVKIVDPNGPGRTLEWPSKQVA